VGEDGMGHYAPCQHCSFEMQFVSPLADEWIITLLCGSPGFNEWFLLGYASL
jgi:hypothetical protein